MLSGLSYKVEIRNLKHFSLLFAALPLSLSLSLSRRSKDGDDASGSGSYNEHRRSDGSWESSQSGDVGEVEE